MCLLTPLRTKLPGCPPCNPLLYADSLERLARTCDTLTPYPTSGWLLDLAFALCVHPLPLRRRCVPRPSLVGRGWQLSSHLGEAACAHGHAELSCAGLLRRIRNLKNWTRLRVRVRDRVRDRVRVRGFADWTRLTPSPRYRSVWWASRPSRWCSRQRVNAANRLCSASAPGCDLSSCYVTANASTYSVRRSVGARPSGRDLRTLS